MSSYALDITPNVLARFPIGPSVASLPATCGIGEVAGMRQWPPTCRRWSLRDSDGGRQRRPATMTGDETVPAAFADRARRAVRRCPERQVAGAVTSPEWIHASKSETFIGQEK